MRIVRLKAVRLVATLVALIVLCSTLVAPAGAIGVEGQWVPVAGPPGAAPTSIVPSPIHLYDSTVFVSTSSAGVFRSSNGGGSFTRLNNGLTDLTVHDLAVSPKVWIDGIMLAATGSGVFRTTDTGLNWSAVGSDLGTGNVQSVAMSADFENDHNAYAAVYGSGIYRSQDGGVTWVNPGVGGMDDLAIRGVRVSPAGPKEVFAWTSTKIFRSVNYGKSWTRVSKGLPDGAGAQFLRVNLTPDFRNSKTLFLATAHEGLYKSTDSGLNWASAGLTDMGRINGVVFSPNYGQDEKVFVATQLGGIFKSVDRGVNWNDINVGLTGLDFSVVAITHAFLDDHTLFAASHTGILYKTTNTGADWFKISGVASAQIAGIGFSSNYGVDATLVGATHSGVFRSDDGGWRWTSITADLPNTDFEAFAVSPNYPADGTVVAMLGDAGIYRTFNSGEWWGQQNEGTTSVLRAVPRTIAFSPNFANDNLVLAGGGSGAFRSIDGGATWTQANEGSTYTDVASFGFSPAIAADGVVFAGTAGGGLFKSVDAGQSWTQSSTGVTNGMINAVAVSPSFATDRTVLIATAGGIFKSTDGGATWTGVHSGNFIGLALSPDFGSDRFAFAITEGPGGRVFGSSDGGDTWSELGNGLASDLPTMIAVSPDYGNDQNVFVGTSNYGLWVFKGTPS